MASPPPIDTLDAFLKPRSVAIVGASDDPKRISGRPLSYMISAGFAGTIYPVNPNRARVQGIEAYPSVAALPEAPDLAIVAVAAAHARAAVEECAALGVRGALLFTAGFAEAGAEGQRLQDDLLGIARRAGVRLAGPNFLGMARAGSGLSATFSNIFDRGFLRPGPIGLVSQSGAFGGHLAYAGRAKGLGIGHWATTGNEADVSVAEWIGWMAREPEVRVIVAYAEAVRDGATLVESLRAAHEAGKPVVMMKVGRSASGARAAASRAHDDCTCSRSSTGSNVASCSSTCVR